nr:hypothetical protein [Tanacetum cinerariifolium]
MSTSKFAETHNLVAFLKKPTEFEGFEQIVDFLNANPIKYALTVNLPSTPHGKKIIITEASIRRDLRLDDVEDTPILTQPSSSQPQRKHKSRRTQRKETKVPHTEPQPEEHIPTPSHDPLPSGEDRMQLSELMEICTKLSDMVLSLEQIKTNQAAKIKKLRKRVKKLEGEKKKRTHRLKRLYKVGLTARVESFEEKEASENVEQDATVAEKEVSVAADEVVTTAESVEASKPKVKGVTIQEPSEFRTTTPSQSSQPPQAKDKGKGIMIELEKPLKKKDQIAFDEEVARKLDAQMKAVMEEEERIAREKNKANKAVIEEWDDVQTIIDADRQLAEQLQAQERE